MYDLLIGAPEEFIPQKAAQYSAKHIIKVHRGVLYICDVELCMYHMLLPLFTCFSMGLPYYCFLETCNEDIFPTVGHFLKFSNFLLTISDTIPSCTWGSFPL
jgi:hypothetical protein